MNKNSNISLLRIIAICAIVFAHSYDYYGLWESFFPGTEHIDYERERSFMCETALDIFVLISGYLYAANLFKGKYQQTLPFLRDKVYRLVIPYFVWGIIMTLLFPDWMTILNFFSGCHHLWFLLMLFGCFVLIRFVRIEKLQSIMSWGGVILLAIMLYPILTYLLHRIPNIFTWQTIVRYFYGFLIGCFIAWLEKTNKCKVSNERIIFYSQVLFIIAVVLNVTFLPKYFKYIKVIPIFLSLFFLLLYLNKSITFTLPKWLYSIDKNSMGIYLIHQILIFEVLLYVPGYQKFMDAYHVLAPILLFSFSFLSSWGVSLLISKSSIFSAMLLGEKVISLKNKSIK